MRSNPVRNAVQNIYIHPKNNSTRSPVALVMSHLRCSTRRGMARRWTCGPLGKGSNCPLFRSYLHGHFIGRIITYVLLCGYSPFRSDDMKELIRATTEANIEFHERFWFNVSAEGQSQNIAARLWFLM